MCTELGGVGRGGGGGGGGERGRFLRLCSSYVPASVTVSNMCIVFVLSERGLNISKEG